MGGTGVPGPTRDCRGFRAVTLWLREDKVMPCPVVTAARSPPSTRGRWRHGRFKYLNDKKGIDIDGTDIP